jgi:hypothetical protein
LSIALKGLIKSEMILSNASLVLLSSESVLDIMEARSPSIAAIGVIGRNVCNQLFPWRQNLQPQH